MSPVADEVNALSVCADEPLIVCIAVTALVKSSSVCAEVPLIVSVPLAVEVKEANV
jgi:hypothetical protein